MIEVVQLGKSKGKVFLGKMLLGSALLYLRVALEFVENFEPVTASIS